MGESSNSGQYQKLPPGWDCKFDQATGNCYYVNYLTRAMQLEDPRIRYKQLQNERCSTESIPLQPLHGSPYHVYPSNNLPAMRAFQIGPNSSKHPSWQHMSSSPLLSRGNLEMSPVPFPKLSVTQTPRLGNMSRRSTIQETSFSNHIDTDAVVTKIQNMFPTASENHIRLLLRRYYNREAVVISALQVEKHPVTMPGPFVTPPAQRHLFHSNSAFQMTPPSRRLDIGHSLIGHAAHGSGTSRTASPLPGGRFGSVISMNSSGRGADGTAIISGLTGIHAAANGAFSYPATSSVLYHGSPRFGEQWRSSPKPHSSPKMKLRYMKTIFPKADEMIILDVLTSSDNNVQKASQTLISMGYAKREVLPQKPSRLGANADGAGNGGADQADKAQNEQHIPLHPKEYTQEEKDEMQKRLKLKYAQIAERIILMALESVNYSEDRAVQILQIVQDEEDGTRAKGSMMHGSADAALIGPGYVGHVPLAMDCSELESLIGKTTENANINDNIITIVVEESQQSSTDDNNANQNRNNDNNKITNNYNSKNDKGMLIEKAQESSENKNTTATATTTTITSISLSTSTVASATATAPTTMTTASTSALALKSSTSFTTKTKTTSSSSSPLLLSATSTSTRQIPKSSFFKKKRAFPSINVTTPTTATTQIILSNSPIYVENEMADGNDEKQHGKPRSLNSNEANKMLLPSSSSLSIKSQQQGAKSSSASPSIRNSSSPSPFETITLKRMLARFNFNSTAKNKGHVPSSSSSIMDATSNAYGTVSLLEKLRLSSRPRDKFDTLKYTQQRDASGHEVDGPHKHEFKSLLGRIATQGPNTGLSKGPDESLLLADYVTWNGANPDISVGQKHLATGADPTLLSERNFLAHGRNTDLCKGPQVGLAKGSIYAQLSTSGSNNGANIKCN